MIKQLILLVHFFGVYLFQLFFLANVTATQQFNSTIAPNSETTVTITIHKGDLTGFAKFQEELPAGFSAEVMESKGANFSFKDQKVKLIWMSLPSNSEISVSYKLISSANVTGTYTLAGKFSFIADNERTNIDIEPKDITVSEDAVVADNNQNTTETTKSNNQKNTAPNISAKRTIDDLGEGKYKVSIKITKSNIEGFAKITENIPTGFNVVANEPQGGNFSFKNNEAKILWMAFPNENEFTISYFLLAKEAINDDYVINGVISYLENDVTKNYDLSSTNFTVKLTNPTIADVGNNTDNTSTNKTNNNTEESAADNTTSENNNRNNNAVTSTPNPETGISYKVQIAALRAQKSVNFIAKKLKVSQSISIEANEGWSKYIVGKYDKYKAARDARNSIRKNVKRAFVTAYNQGKRITVQEALMISNQKWYK